MTRTRGWSWGGQRRLRAGTVVEVKSAEEILATLDQDGAVDHLPFMPEMLRFAGKRFTVSKRAEQSCDTIRSYRSRRMRNAVHLDDLRCDGSAHGGCQAGCLLYWKESWLKRPAAGDMTRRAAEPSGESRVQELLLSKTVQRSSTGIDSAPVKYRCQATEMFRATEPIRRWDLRKYLRELWSGNVAPLRFLTVTARSGYKAARRRLGLDSPLPLQGTRTGPTPTGDLDLQPGEWVRIRSKEQIAETLNRKCRNRGLWFDSEMLPYCGETHRVQQRVSRIVDDRSGELIELKSDTLILEGVTCSGDHSERRLFCPRGLYPYWREVWLERVPVSEPASVRNDASVEDQE